MVSSIRFAPLGLERPDHPFSLWEGVILVRGPLRVEGLRPDAKTDARLPELGIEGSVRAEALDVEQHLRLYRTFGR